MLCGISKYLHVLLGTSRYLQVLCGISKYLQVLLGTLRHFEALLSTCKYFHLNDICPSKSCHKESRGRAEVVHLHKYSNIPFKQVVALNKLENILNGKRMTN